MKNLSLKLVYALILSTLIVTACNPLKKMKSKANLVSYDAKPNPLELRGDSVEVTVTGKVPAKFFHKKVSVSLNPSLDYAGGSTKLKPFTLKGESVTGEGVTINQASGGTFTYKEKIAYKPEMAVSELNFNPVAMVAKKSMAFDTVKVADGVLTTAQSVQLTDAPLLGQDNFAKVVPVELKGKVMFELDKSNVRDNQKKSADVKAFEQFLKSGNELTGISISSYASPDGELTRNDKLSVDRTEATYKFFLAWLKKQGVTQVNDSSFYKKSATAEDWDGLKQIAASSDLADRDQIVNIVSTISDATEREKEMKKLKSYRKIADKLLPQLRRSEVTFIATEKRKADSVISKEAKADSNSLTVEEFLYAATLTADNNEKLAIYNKAAAKYSNDWRASNNAAYVLLLQGGKADDALKLLSKSAELSKDNAIVYNNMGVAYAQKKDNANAEKYYTLAKSLGAPNNVNLANTKVRQGDYAAASSYYGTNNSCSYNAALSATMAGKFEDAKKSADCAPQDANMYYLKAVIGARSNNIDFLTTNLTRAIREDASLRERAKKDMEFKKFMDTDAFKVAIR
jgi:Flp pilus assembly protein TadD